MKTVMKNSIIGLISVLSLSAWASVQGFSRRSIQTEIEIDASAEQVWKVLTDFQNYPNWNPFIRKISGDLEVNAKLDVEIKPADKEAMGFKPRLLVVKPQQEMRWLGRVLLPRVFDGEHYFIIEEISANRVKLIHGEKFRGGLVPVLWSGMEKSTIEGFKVMNLNLKNQVERQILANRI